MKKTILLLVIVCMISLNAFAQGNEERNDHNNIISLSFGIVGAELSYERMLSNYLSVLGSVSYTTLFFLDEFTLSGKGRWYPFGKTFYMEMGLGYTYGRGVLAFADDMGTVLGHFLLGILTFGAWFAIYDFEEFEAQPRTSGLLLQPGLGWNVRLGRNGRLYLPISAGVNFKLAEKPDLMAYARLGLGFSF